MFGINWWQKIAKALIVYLMTGVLALSMVSCGDSLPFKNPFGERDSFASRFAGSDGDPRAATETGDRSASRSQPSGNISEVSPPEVIQQLREALEIYQPQVAILSPQADEVLQDNTVTVQFQVQDLPIFKNQELDMGPHLHVILDNQPYIAVYDLNQPLVFPDLPPGTHTLRVFASRPWHESFKNEGAYAQTTFHIFTKTQDNNPDPAQPLLTYSRPKGSYGAEPILLDFYLTNAPLHLAAQENPNDDIADWRIRCTINGDSFVLDRWESVYLKGFKPGKNWVQLEFLDEQGNPLKNVFNSTVRLITYEPKGKDTLSKLVRGELSAAEARGIVDANDTAKIPTASPTPAPSPSPTPSPVPTLTPSPTPSAVPTPTPSATPSAETTPETQLGEDKAAQPDDETKESAQTSKTDSEKLENKKPGGFFNRFRRPPAATPSPSLPPTLPEVNEAPSPESIAPDVTAPQPENTPEPQPLVTPREETAPEVEPAPSPEPELKESKQHGSMREESISTGVRGEIDSSPDSLPHLPPEKQKPGGFFNRFRRSAATPSPNVTPTLPEIIDPTSSELVPPEAAPQPESSPESERLLSPTPSLEPTTPVE